MSKLTTLREVLLTAADLPWDATLFMKLEERWTLDSTCAVLQVNRDASGHEAPEFAAQHGLCYAMGIPQVQDIVANARLQDARIKPERLLQAFLFYYDHDAFIDFSKEEMRP